LITALSKAYVHEPNSQLLDIGCGQRGWMVRRKLDASGGKVPVAATWAARETGSL
jgi:hypothetical protein